MKIYLAGPITGVENYADNFNLYEQKFKTLGCKVMNPTVLPLGFEHHEYMEICYKMIDACGLVVMLPGAAASKGAQMELRYALSKGMLVLSPNIMEAHVQRLKAHSDEA